MTAGKDSLQPPVGHNGRLVNVLAHHLKCRDSRVSSVTDQMCWKRAHHTLHAGLSPVVSVNLLDLMRCDEAFCVWILDHYKGGADRYTTGIRQQSLAGSNGPPPLDSCVPSSQRRDGRGGLPLLLPERSCCGSRQERNQPMRLLQAMPKSRIANLRLRPTITGTYSLFSEST